MWTNIMWMKKVDIIKKIRVYEKEADNGKRGI